LLLITATVFSKDGYGIKPRHNRRNYSFRKRQNHHKTKIFLKEPEVVYRITLLIKPTNGGSLVSVLKAIRTTGISQGSAGTVFYLV
jgi:hypothetical protein